MVADYEQAGQLGVQIPEREIFSIRRSHESFTTFCSFLSVEGTLEAGLMLTSGVIVGSRGSLIIWFQFRTVRFLKIYLYRHLWWLGNVVGILTLLPTSLMKLHVMLFFRYLFQDFVMLIRAFGQIDLLKLSQLNQRMLLLYLFWERMLFRGMIGGLFGVFSGLLKLVLASSFSPEE